LLLGVSVLLLSVPRPAASQDVALFYEENCSACHTIGGGPQGGPDLHGVTGRVDRQWLLRFMLDPEALVKSEDPYALKIVEEWNGDVMPATEGLTPELAGALLRYIEEQSGAPAASHDPSVAEEMATPEKVEAGRQIFVGARGLAEGGPGCVGCHRLEGLPGWNGGRLGPDLTAVRDRLRGSDGISTWLGNPPTPIMKAVYRRAAMTHEERDALASLFVASAGRPRTEPGGSPLLQFAGTGVAGALLAAGAIAFSWRRRFRGVRESFVDAARKRVHGDQR
jgi:mono/diheme cytochrome c family protein